MPRKRRGAGKELRNVLNVEELDILPKIVGLVGDMRKRYRFTISYSKIFGDAAEERLMFEGMVLNEVPVKAVIE